MSPIGRTGETTGSVWRYHHVDDLPITDEQRRAFDELTLAKIDLATEPGPIEP